MIFIGIGIGIVVGSVLSFATLLMASRGELIVIRDKEDGNVYFNVGFKSKGDIYETADTSAKFVIFRIKR